MQYAGVGALGMAGALSLGGVRRAQASEKKDYQMSDDKTPFKILGGGEDLIEPVLKGYENTFGRVMEGTLKTHAEVNNIILTGGDRVYDAAET
jgi:hypothetical protein